MSEATEIASMGITTMIELMQARDEIKRLKEALAKQEQGGPVALDEYDAGIFSCAGGGDVAWWHDYIRAELGHAYEHYQSQMPPQPKQEQGEPVASYIREKDMLTRDANWVAEYPDMCEPLYTTPQQRKPLTDEQIDETIQHHIDPVATYKKLHDFARAIEAAHGIKE